MATLVHVFSRHRPLAARLIALAGLAAVAAVLAPRVPRPVKVDLLLGPAHQEFVEVRVAYLQEGEELHGVAFNFPSGAPPRVHHEVSLPAGDFEVHTELRRADGRSQACTRSLHAPATGTVLIPLVERAQ